MAHHKSYLYSEQEQFFTSVYRCLSHPARLRIINDLNNEPLSYQAIIENHPLDIKTISGHLTRLVKLGIIYPTTLKNRTVYSITNDQLVADLMKLYNKHQVRESKPPKWYNRFIPTLALYGEA